MTIVTKWSKIIQCFAKNFVRLFVRLTEQAKKCEFLIILVTKNHGAIFATK